MKIPASCGVCEHSSHGETGPAYCYHPDKPLLTLHVPRVAKVAPPRICPIRRAAEIREAEERGARWMREAVDADYHWHACGPDPLPLPDPVGVCAARRAKEEP